MTALKANKAAIWCFMPILNEERGTSARLHRLLSRRKVGAITAKQQVVFRRHLGTVRPMRLSVGELGCCGRATDIALRST